jgi:hypothetical protein
VKPDATVISGARDDEETTLDSAQEASAAGVVGVFAEDFDAAGNEPREWASAGSFGRHHLQQPLHSLAHRCSQRLFRSCDV